MQTATAAVPSLQKQDICQGKTQENKGGTRVLGDLTAETLPQPPPPNSRNTTQKGMGLEKD